MNPITRERSNVRSLESHEIDSDGIEYVGNASEAEPGLNGNVPTLIFEGGITKYVEPLLIYKWLLIGCVLASILLGWLALLLWPRAYVSTAKLQLLIGRESVGLDPSSTTSQTMFLQKTPEEDVNSALEILTSRAIAETVVDRIGAENILSGYLPSAGGDPEPDSLAKRTQAAIGNVVSSAFDLSGVRDKISDRERAIVELQRKIAIFAPKKSSTMIVQAEAKSPEMAQTIVQSMVDSFLERHVNVGTTDGTYQFFESQAAVAEEKLIELLDQRTNMLQSEKMASVESKYKSLTEQLAVIEAEIIKSEAQLRRTQAEIDDITFHMAHVDTEIIASLQTQPDLTLSNMRTSLYQAELEEKRLAEMYQDDNPKLLAIRKQVASARQSLDEIESTSESQNKTPNPILVKLEEQLLTAKTAAVGLASLLEKCASQKEQKITEINRLLEFENSLKRMDREIDVASKSLAILKEKEEQSRVIEDLRQKQISSIGIAQPASFVEKPVSPKKPVLAVAFVMLGLMTGVGLVYLREFTRRTIRRPEEVERILRYPVLSELSHRGVLARVKAPTETILRSRRATGLLDACQAIQSELMLNGSEKTDQFKPRARTIGVIGVTDNCGASSIAMALALAYSERNGLKTALIDLDTKRGTVSKGFGLMSPTESSRARRRGNPEALPNERNSDYGLRLFGCTSRQASELISGSYDDVMISLEELSQENSIVIVDLPPASRLTNAVNLTKCLDQVIIVVASDQTETKATAKLLGQFEKNDVEVVGIVVNKSKRYLARWVEGILG